MKYGSNGDIGLPAKEYRLAQRVLRSPFLGSVAHASLLTVLLDGATKFRGLAEGQEEMIRERAHKEGVKLPI